MLGVIAWHIKEVLDKLAGLADSQWLVLSCLLLVDNGIVQFPMEPPLVAIRKKTRVEIHAKPSRACQSVSSSACNDRKETNIHFVCRYERSVGIDG